MTQQSFIHTPSEKWQALPQFPGTHFLPLAEPVPTGSIHRLRMDAGAIIPKHTHPCDEYVYVISGEIETGGRKCTAGTYWLAPANIRQGPHKAITSTEIITIRLGPMGEFEQLNHA